MNVISTRSIEIAAGVVADPAIRPGVKAWMQRAAARHIRKSPDMMSKVVSRHHITDEIQRNAHSKAWRLGKVPTKALIEKLSIQLAAGADIYVFGIERNETFERFRNEARSVLDWLDAIPEGDRHLRRIDRMSYEQAAGLSVAWHQRLLALTADADDPDVAEEIELVEAYEDGCRFVELKGPVALLREGYLMGHCVGGKGYVQAVMNGGIRIFSLRDAFNRPHVTIEVRRTFRNKAYCASQIKGRGNIPPAAGGSWAAYCRPFVIANRWEVTYDGNCVGLFTINGVTYDNPDDMLGALLDNIGEAMLPSLRNGSLSRMLGDAAIGRLIGRRIAEVKQTTRRRLLDMLTPDRDPHFQTDTVLARGPAAQSIELRSLIMPCALMEALAAGFFTGIEDEAFQAVAPFLDQALTAIEAEPQHIHKFGITSVPKGSDLLQQVIAFCGLTKKLDAIRALSAAARNKTLVDLSSEIRRAARAGKKPPPEVNDWARELAHLDLASGPAVAKMALDSRYLLI